MSIYCVVYPYRCLLIALCSGKKTPSLEKKFSDFSVPLLHLLCFCTTRSELLKLLAFLSDLVRSRNALHSHLHGYFRVRFVTFHFEIVKLKIINVVHFSLDDKFWKRFRLS